MLYLIVFAGLISGLVLWQAGVDYWLACGVITPLLLVAFWGRFLWYRSISQQMFSLGAIRLLAKLAKADGVVSVGEIKLFRKMFKIGVVDEVLIGALFNSAWRDSGFFADDAKMVKQYGNPSYIELCLKAVYKMAMLDGGCHYQQESMVKSIERIFALDDDVVSSIRERSGFVNSGYNYNHDYRAGKKGKNKSAYVTSAIGDESPYTVLGVKDGASLTEIKQKYRKLVRENHPDKLRSLNVGDTALADAEEKIVRFNTAYDEIMRGNV